MKKNNSKLTTDRSQSQEPIMDSSYQPSVQDVPGRQPKLGTEGRLKFGMGAGEGRTVVGGLPLAKDNNGEYNVSLKFYFIEDSYKLRIAQLKVYNTFWCTFIFIGIYFYRKKILFLIHNVRKSSIEC